MTEREAPGADAAAELEQLALAVERLKAEVSHLHENLGEPEEVRDTPFGPLVDRVRAEVGARRIAVADYSAPQLEIARFVPPEVRFSASLAPLPPRLALGDHTLGELLAYEGEDFVANAYRAILRREPDPGGLAHHLDVLYRGGLSKTQMLADFRNSTEGRVVGAKIRGLDRALRMQRLRSIPLLGPIIGLAHLIMRLPMMARDIEQHEMLLFRRKRELAATIAALDTLSARTAAALDSFGGLLQRLDHEKASRSVAQTLTGRLAALNYEVMRIDDEIRRRARMTDLLSIGESVFAASGALLAAIAELDARKETPHSESITAAEKP